MKEPNLYQSPKASAVHFRDGEDMFGERPPTIEEMMDAARVSRLDKARKRRALVRLHRNERAKLSRRQNRGAK